MKERMLTQGEQDRIADDPIRCMEVTTKLLEAQDAKTRAATLRECGEWLVPFQPHWQQQVVVNLKVTRAHVETLLAGKAPWEKEAKGG